LAIGKASSEPVTAKFVILTIDTNSGETIMFRGGLLWLIGIPLPIILILFFLGYLS
jgi:hypothetical protein